MLQLVTTSSGRALSEDGLLGVVCQTASVRRHPSGLVGGGNSLFVGTLKVSGWLTNYDAHEICVSW